jgi:hypothetical protein
MRNRALDHKCLSGVGAGIFRIQVRYFPNVDAVEPPPGSLLNVRVTGRHKAMITALSKRRFDEQLEAILDDAGD